MIPVQEHRSQVCNSLTRKKACGDISRQSPAKSVLCADDGVIRPSVTYYLLTDMRDTGIHKPNEVPKGYVRNDSVTSFVDNRKYRMLGLTKPTGGNPANPLSAFSTTFI